MRDPRIERSLRTQIIKCNDQIEALNKDIEGLKRQLAKANKERVAAVEELQKRRDHQAGLHTKAAETVAKMKAHVHELSLAVEALK